MDWYQFNPFGYIIKKKKEETPEALLTSTQDDGSTIINTGSAAGLYTHVMNMDVLIKNESDAIRRYREISKYPEVDIAIDEIVNEAICVDNENNICTLNLHHLKLPESIKTKINESFEEVINLLNFEKKAHDYFRNWYIDGRQYFLITVDKDSPRYGIQQIDMIDAQKIRKIKKIHKKKDPQSGIDVIDNIEEFFIFNERGINATVNYEGTKLSVDSVVYCTSGLFDQVTNMMMGYLHKAIKPTNQLKMIEDATVIYKIARAPERRIFYIDVGNLPKSKAEQYLTDVMNKYKNKIVYDAQTGEIRSQSNHQSMLEDFYLARRDGGKGTEITTLPSTGGFNNMDDVEYFRQKVYMSLNVPISRLLPQQNFSLGRSNEITRDELKFNKFVKRLRNKYSQVLLDILKIQLITKNIIKSEEWEDIVNDILIIYNEDNNFVELKETELLSNRLTIVQQIEPYIGKYFSEKWVKTNVLRLTDEDIKNIDRDISTEGSTEGSDTKNESDEIISDQEEDEENNNAN